MYENILTTNCRWLLSNTQLAYIQWLQYSWSNNFISIYGNTLNSSQLMKVLISMMLRYSCLIIRLFLYCNPVSFHVVWWSNNCINPLKLHYWIDISIETAYRASITITTTLWCIDGITLCNEWEFFQQDKSEKPGWFHSKICISYRD